MIRALSVASLLFLALTASGGAQEGRLVELLPESPQTRFQSCLALAEVEPVRALEEAESWELASGGNLARECGAVALLALGQPGRAAERLFALAREIGPYDPDYALGLHRRAGQLWLQNDEPMRAVQALGAALALSPDDPDLLAQRGRAWSAAGLTEEALADLRRATELAPARPDLMALRAMQHRDSGLFQEAARDFTAAIALGGDAAELLLERGRIRLEQDDRDAARADLQAAIDAAPESIAAEIARRRLAALNGGAE